MILSLGKLCGKFTFPSGVILSRRFLPTLHRIYDMDQKKVIVIHEDNSASVNISFRFVNELRKIDRIFNLQRKMEEEISVVLARISANISKTGTKKRKKKDGAEPVVFSIPVNMISVSGDSNPIVGDPGDSDPIVGDRGRVEVHQPLPSNMTCYDAFVRLAAKNNLLIDNEKYFLDVNPPVVQSIELPKCIMAGFLISPSKLKTLFTDKDKCIFKWYKSELKFNTIKDAQARLPSITWIQLGQGYFCKTTNEDVGSVLKVVVTPYLDERKGEDVEVITPALVSAGPGECPFERRHLHTKLPAGERSLRVISYNILADLYADSDHARTHLFSTCPPYAIDIDYRKQLLIKEILGYNGDLMCLQEVDEKVFEYDLKPAFGHNGMEGYYDAKGGQVSEGLAIFFRKNKLRILERSRFVLSEELQTNVLFAEMWEKLQRNPALKERVEKRTTTLQVSVLESVEDPSRLIVVGVTHLYFRPDADHIRILQGGICMQILQQIVCLYQAKHPDKVIGLLFCGDFNSTPDFGIYRFLTTQLIDTDDVDWTSCPEECIKDIELHHDFEMDSACGCPPYTNYTVGFNGCLDYIFYQTDKFTVKKVIPMPTHEEVTEHIALPSITFPSDHIPIIVDLEFNAR